MENIVVNVSNVSKTFKIDKPKGISALIKKNLNSKQLKKLVAVNNISFSVKQGEIIGIIGLNGSGKTTLLRLIAGVYTPDTGSITINGKLSPLLQLGAGFQGELVGRENIIMNGMLLGIPKSEIEQKAESIMQYAELEKFSNLKLKHYSSGMKARLAFSTAMQITPDILLVDEIQAVGDKEFKKKSNEAFLSFKNDKKTILHATHTTEKLSEYCDRILLLHQGQMVGIGNPDEMLKKYSETKRTK